MRPSVLARDADYSVGGCAYVAGQKVVDLVAGPHLGVSSLASVFSSTKGAAGICIALLIERRQQRQADPRQFRSGVAYATFPGVCLLLSTRPTLVKYVTDVDQAYLPPMLQDEQPSGTAGGWS
jgi:hypothetical protein